MAIDTRAKRSSVIGVGLPVPSTLPDTDGTIAAIDRQWLAWLYSGIAAGAPSLALPTFGTVAGVSGFGTVKGTSAIGTI
jgi:hypothetical protein